MLGKNLERICKAVLLLCLVHFIIMTIFYLDVYTQRFDIFSRFNSRNYSKMHQYFNISKPNGTSPAILGGEDHFVSSRKLESNLTVTKKPLPLCPDVPQGLGRMLNSTFFSCERKGLICVDLEKCIVILVAMVSELVCGANAEIWCQ